MKGLVQVNEHAVLPNVTPGVALGCTVVCAAGVLWRVRHRSIYYHIVLSCFSFFLFGWHVHEKAILMILIPLQMFFPPSHKGVYFLSCVSSLSLLPLIPTWTEQVFIVPYTLLVLTVQSRYLAGTLNMGEKIYLAGGMWVAVLYYYMTWVYPGMYLPLAVVSVCSM